MKHSPMQQPQNCLIVLIFYIFININFLRWSQNETLKSTDTTGIEWNTFPAASKLPDITQFPYLYQFQFRRPSYNALFITGVLKYRRTPVHGSYNIKNKRIFFVNNLYIYKTKLEKTRLSIYLLFATLLSCCFVCWNFS